MADFAIKLLFIFTPTKCFSFLLGTQQAQTTSSRSHKSKREQGMKPNPAQSSPVNRQQVVSQGFGSDITLSIDGPHAAINPSSVLSPKGSFCVPFQCFFQSSMFAFASLNLVTYNYFNFFMTF